MISTDKRHFDLENIAKAKQLQSLLWVIFFFIIIIAIICATEQMARISKSSMELKRLEPLKIYNKLGQIINEYKNPRFSINDKGKTIDWLKYWQKKWNISVILFMIVVIIAILLEILIISQIKFLQRKEIHLIHKYELERSEEKDK
jgi:beta-lactamase regulating signal transducer with metallopeptidase domain